MKNPVLPGSNSRPNVSEGYEVTVIMIGRNSSALGDDSGVEWDLSPLLDYS